MTNNPKATPKSVTNDPIICPKPDKNINTPPLPSLAQNPPPVDCEATSKITPRRSSRLTPSKRKVDGRKSPTNTVNTREAVKARKENKSSQMNTFSLMIESSLPWSIMIAHYLKTFGVYWESRLDKQICNEVIEFTELSNYGLEIWINDVIPIQFGCIAKLHSSQASYPNRWPLSARKTYCPRVAPLSKRQVQQFLGVINYIRDFIPHVDHYTHHLLALLKKKPPEWNADHTIAVTTLKQITQNPPPLKLITDGKRILQTDASDESWGAILLEDIHGKEHFIAYASGQFSDTQKHYHSVFKEILAVKNGIKKFEYHLIGHHFLIRMDSSAFPNILNFKGHTSNIQIQNSFGLKTSFPNRQWMNPDLLNQDPPANQHYQLNLPKLTKPPKLPLSILQSVLPKTIIALVHHAVVPPALVWSALSDNKSRTLSDFRRRENFSFMASTSSSPPVTLSSTLSLPRSCTSHTTNKIENLVEYSYIPESAQISESSYPLISPYQLYKRPSSFTRSIRTLISTRRPQPKEYIQSSRLDQCALQATSAEQYVTLLILTLHGRKGLPVTARLALLDTRFKQYQDAVIGTVLTTLHAGSVLLTFYPNFNLSLQDPNLPTTLKVQVKIQSAEQISSAKIATLHHQLVYRLQNHALDLPTPEHHFDTLMVLAESDQIPTIIQIPRQIPRHELIKFMPLEWISNYEQFHNNTAPIQTSESMFERRQDGTVRMTFQPPPSAPQEPPRLSFTYSSMITAVQTAQEDLPITGFTFAGYPVCPAKHSGHFLWDAPGSGIAQNDTLVNINSKVEKISLRTEQLKTQVDSISAQMQQIHQNLQSRIAQLDYELQAMLAQRYYGPEFDQKEREIRRLKAELDQIESEKQRPTIFTTSPPIPSIGPTYHPFDSMLSPIRQYDPSKLFGMTYTLFRDNPLPPPPKPKPKPKPQPRPVTLHPSSITIPGQHSPGPTPASSPVPPPPTESQPPSQSKDKQPMHYHTETDTESSVSTSDSEKSYADITRILMVQPDQPPQGQTSHTEPYVDIPSEVEEEMPESSATNQPPPAQTQTGSTSQKSSDGATTQSVLREFATRFTGALRDWFDSLGRYRQLQFVDLPEVSSALAVLHDQFLGDPSAVFEAARRDYLNMKCCSLNAKDLDFHYKRMSLLFYKLNGFNEPTLKHVFLASLPDELQPDIQRQLTASNLSLDNISLGKIFQLAKTCLDKLCEQKSNAKRKMIVIAVLKRKGILRKCHYAKDCPNKREKSIRLVEHLQATTDYSPEKDELEFYFSEQDEPNDETVFALQNSSDDSDSDQSQVIFHQQLLSLDTTVPIPSIKLQILPSKFQRPIPAIGLIDTGAQHSMLNPHILPPDHWIESEEHFNAVNGKHFTTSLITKKPIGIQIFSNCVIWTKVIGSTLPNKDILLGFDILHQLKHLQIIPTGIRVKSMFKPFTNILKLYNLSETPPSYQDISTKLLSFCPESHIEFTHPTPLWKNESFFIKLLFKLNEDINPTKATHPGMSPSDLLLAQQECSQLLAQGLIEPTNSQWACQAFYVEKHSEIVRGKKRLVIDYQPLNMFLQDDKFPLPRRQNMFTFLKHAQIFSKFDLKSGFWQLGIEPSERYKTAFCIPNAHFQWIVLPFGLKTAPSIFQKSMVKIFQPILHHALIYIDDILLF
ncbi:hypothetical protein KPL71_000978 [Citrus sinensis]|uniref:Uncharacterized protein n=1 Tax=Citrus sinensis TaxID=2711 RepID=A0ACB8NU15_CITSI|nr:hypothetical protein KPL71_000978 [Citrus sinensis]